MAVATEFIDFFVRRTAIDRKYPGGWAQCLQDHEEALGQVVWYDDHLLRDGSMGAAGIRELMDFWTGKGLTATVERDGKLFWEDFCFSDWLNDGAPPVT